MLKFAVTIVAGLVIILPSFAMAKEISDSLDTSSNRAKDPIKFIRKGAPLPTSVWTHSVEEILQSEVQAEAAREKLSARSIGQSCNVSFKLSKDRSLSEVKITRSSLSKSFDRIVLNTLKRLNGKTFLQFPDNLKDKIVDFNVAFGLSERERSREESSDQSLRGNSKKMNGVDTRRSKK